jgi:tRNA(Ile)-lysidine synthase
MKIGLAAYMGKKICIAVSGGRDSMALLHYLCGHSTEFGIALSALNCDHGMRAESSSDSAFVKEWCRKNGVPLLCYRSEVKLKTETEAREWRRSCYFKAVKGVDGSGMAVTCGADFIATAHHLNDNAETVLFNLARGSALAGATGIADSVVTDGAGDKLNLIRPLIGCSRREIDEYVAENAVPYVDDKTNFSDAYTRNYIRINVLPALEKAVPGAAEAIFRFSRLAEEDEEFFRAEINRRGIVAVDGERVFIKHSEKPLFARAAVEAVKNVFKRKDYTSAQIETLCGLLLCENGKRFEFLGLTAYKEYGGISITETLKDELEREVSFYAYLRGNSSIYGRQFLNFTENTDSEGQFDGKKVLKFDIAAIPEEAVIRFMKSGDKFTKFGGGTKKLGDFFTDRKVPLRKRKNIPLIAVGSEVLVVCGVEISEKIKVTDKTEKVCYAVSDSI